MLQNACGAIQGGRHHLSHEAIGSRNFWDVSMMFLILNVCFSYFGPGLILHDVTYVGRFCLLILGGRSLGCKHGTFLVFRLSARRGCLHISLQKKVRSTGI